MKRGKKEKKVGEFDIEGKLTRTFENCHTAAEKTGVGYSTMCQRVRTERVLNGKQYKYISKEEDEQFKREHGVVFIPNIMNRAHEKALEHFRRKPYS